jgi:hypothetical protein
MIIIIAEPNDIHAQVVARRLETRGEACITLNAADFPQRWDITTEYSGSEGCDLLVTPAGEIRGSEITGLWVRRLSAHEISPEIADPTVARFAYEQCRDHFLSFADSIPNVINPRVAELNAELKPFQLRAAQAVGLRVPKTIISNRADHIKQFVAAANTDIIFKTLTPTGFQFTATSLLNESNISMLDAAKLAPTIFQERIIPGVNIRATIIDDIVFAASIKTETDLGAVDWRLDRDTEIRPYRLSGEIEDRLRALCRKMGLRYGAADLILSTAGEYVFFLEINAGGQFLFVEIHGEIPISEAIADALIGA